MKIIWSKTFLKILKNIGSVSQKDILSLVKKYPHSKNIICIDIKKSHCVLKGYLLGKKIRILILFELVDNMMIPISVVKKESKEGKNIRKENYEEIFINFLSKILRDIDNGNYKEENL